MATQLDHRAKAPGARQAGLEATNVSAQATAARVVGREQEASLLEELSLLILRATSYAAPVLMWLLLVEVRVARRSLRRLRWDQCLLPSRLQHAAA